MPAQWPTKEELELIREYILIQMAQDIAVKNRDEINRTTLTLRDLYVGISEKLLQLLHKRMAEIKKIFRQSQIKVWEDPTHTDMVMYFRYTCRGYEERFGMIKEVLRAELSVMLGEYNRKVFE